MMRYSLSLIFLLLHTPLAVVSLLFLNQEHDSSRTTRRRASSSLSLASNAFETIGSTINLPFPNDQSILGVGGLTYDNNTETWFACSENIIGSNGDETYPEASKPRIWPMKLNFTSASFEFVRQEGDEAVVVAVDPTPGTSTSKSTLKLEDIAAVPTYDPLLQDIWLVSEAHSRLMKTNIFLSKDFGAPDLSSFDPDTYSNSRLVRIDGISGGIIEEVALPNFTQWDGNYNWDGSQCIGDRPFQGAQSLALIPSTDPDFDYKLYVGFQSALYQDGSVPKEFSSSPTRILVYGITSYSSVRDRNQPTATYIKSLRYDTSQLTIASYQKGARHFNALTGILAIDESSFLMAEVEDFYGFGKNQHKIINRIFYVVIDPNKTVDDCSTLTNCAVDAPLKRLIWERTDKFQLDGFGWGPKSNDGRPTVALTFENDLDIGLHIELYALNVDELQNGEPWVYADGSNDILQRRIISCIIGITAFIVIALIQIWVVYNIGKAERAEAFQYGDDKIISKEKKEGKGLLNLSRYVYSDARLSYYALGTAMMNSFFLGGLTFGYSGMALILRKEGAYAESCACGSFCAKQKESLALISTTGFAAAIGSRLFVGLFMDKQGPKLTAIICNTLCIIAFLLLAIPDEEELDTYFLPAWILLSVGGSGLHITGFHFTNLFVSDGKKLASVAISAAFGASSAVFSLMQVLSQYADVKLRSMAIFYVCVVFAIGLNNLFVQPWNKITPRSPFKVGFGLHKREWWVRDLQTKPFLASIIREVVKFNFYGEMSCYTCCLLLLTYYISTSGQLMYELGDAPFTGEPNVFTDYIVARMAGWFNALGFVWFPLVQMILLKFQWSGCYTILVWVNITVIAIVLIKNLEIQMLGFSLLSFARLLLFSCHHAFLLEKFGIEFFGTLNGISSLFAAIIGLVSYPLQLFALKTNYSFSFIPIGCCIVLMLAFPIIMSRQQYLNWAETVSVDPVKFRYPKNIDDVKKLVSHNKKIRCAGAMHSCAPLIASEGIIMSLTKMDKILDINHEKMTIRCQAGARIYNICEALVPYKLAVGTLGTIDWQTISGAVMTGTHGGSLTIPSLHTFITSYKIVKADTSIITVTRESDPKLFSALAPSMGVLGVVVEVEMQCVPMEMLEARFKVITFDELASESVFEGLMRENKYARVVVYPSVNKATIWYANPISDEEVNIAITEGAFDSTKGYMNFRNENEKAWLEQYGVLDKKKKYKLADDVLHKVIASQESRLGRYVGRYNHILCKERNNGIPHADIEFNFDFKKHMQVLQTVKKYCKHNRVPYYNFEIRTTMQDDAMLSCCNGRDAMWIDFQAKAADSVDFFGKIEAELKPIGFRKHWAKGLGNTDPSYVVTQFPNMKEFVKLIAQFDQNGKFRNIEGELWYQEMTELVSHQSEEGSSRRFSLRRRQSTRESIRRLSRSSLRSNSSKMNEVVAYELAGFWSEVENVHVSQHPSKNAQCTSGDEEKESSQDGTDKIHNDEEDNQC